MKNLAYCIKTKDLKIKKPDNVQGTVRIQFQNPAVKDIDLKDSSAVDVFKRIGITEGDIKKSNLQTLLNQGLILLA